MFNKIILLSILSVTCITDCYSFDIGVFPEQPKGGEGILVRIKDKSLYSYEVIYNNKEYPLYGLENGIKEVLIPLDIKEHGIKKLLVRKKILNISMEEKEKVISIKPRKVKNVYLKSSDENMRNQQPAIMEQKKSILEALNCRSSKRLWNKGFIFPLKAYISTQFAVKRIGKTYSYYHKGLDLAVKEGTKVKAANDGKIILGETNLNVYGNTLIIDHGQGVISCYFHLKKLIGKSGQVVKKGEVIAETGNTGWSSGPHLHFGIFLQGEPVDPVWWTMFSKNI